MDLLSGAQRPLKDHEHINVRAGFCITSRVRAEEHQAHEARPVQRLKPAAQLS
jgi:hypothetical protein